ncbi:hypothetical protein BH18ACT1_BH18ACT1_14750 [soil metagenome]
MPAAPRPVRLRLSARSTITAVALLGLALVLLRLLAASGRVIGWVLAAAFVAGLLQPVVAALERRMPHGLALAIVALGALALAGGVAYAVVDDVVAEVADLQETVTDAAEELEASERFGETARELEVADRAEEFVDELPERLRGGNVEDALRIAATRGVAFLATAVLSIFFLVHGPRLLRGALQQLPAARQGDVARLAGVAYRRAWGYVSGSLGMSVVAGLLAYGCAQATGVPGPAPLALWMAVFDLVPLVGAAIGAAPLVLLALANSPTEAIVLGLVFGAWQLVEALALQPRVEARSLHLGPFVTVAVGMIGLELYGIGGALVGLGAAVLVAALADEVQAAPSLPGG